MARRDAIDWLPHLTGPQLDLPNLLGLEPEHGVPHRLHPCRGYAQRGHTTSNPALYDPAHILDLRDRVDLLGLFDTQNPPPQTDVVPCFLSYFLYMIDWRRHDQGLLDRRYLYPSR
jgi:hypothetical protein